MPVRSLKRRSHIPISFLLFFAFSALGADAMAEASQEKVASLIEQVKDRSLDWQERQAAAEELGKIGKPAVPALIDLLEFDNAPSFAHVHLAAQALGEIGPDAADAIPVLAGLLEDFDDMHVLGGVHVAGSASDALARIGPPAVSVLLEAFRHRDARVRREAAGALGHIGPAAREAVPALIGAASADADVGPYAIRALGKIGPVNHAVVPAIVQALKSPQEETIISAMDAIGEIGPAARNATPALTPVMKDERMKIRIKAARAIWRVEGKSLEDVQRLTLALASDEVAYRMFAADALNALGPEAEEAVPALIGAIKDEDPWVRRFAVQAAGSIGPAAKEAVPALVEALKDPAYQLGEEDHGGPRVRRFAAWALGEIGPEAKDAIPALTAALSDDQKWVRSTAEQALAKIAPRE